MAVEDYEQLRQSCTPVRTINAEIEGAEAYLSARKFTAAFGRRTADGYRYIGKATRGSFAVIVDNVQIVQGRCVIDQNNPPPAIEGDVIEWRCTKKPDPDQLFSRARVHRGRYLRISW